MKKILISSFLILLLVGCSGSEEDSNQSYNGQIKTYKSELYNVIKPISPITHYHSGNAILNKYDSASKKQKATVLAHAIGEYKTAIALNPSFAPAYYALAVSYLKGEDEKKALNTLEKCLEIDSNFADAYFTTGIIYEKQGKIDLAQEKYMKSIEINPHNINPYLLLADIEVKKQNYKQAKAYLNEVLKVNSNNKVANAGITYLEKEITIKKEKSEEEINPETETNQEVSNDNKNTDKIVDETDKKD